MFSRIAEESVSLRGRFAVALSGGSTPRLMHRMLCDEPYLSMIPWNRIHIFWVDERCIPISDPASNYGAARADFLDNVPVPENQLHPMPMDVPPEQGAWAYQEELVRFFQTQPSKIPIFDLICLGIGTDGHTASLFPGQGALREKERLVVAVRGGAPDVDRLTMTFPLLNNGRQILFLASGKGKAMILKAILEGPPSRFPAQLIQPLHKNLIWLLDWEAASELGA
jgi:6-phosphogluconolactonase